MTDPAAAEFENIQDHFASQVSDASLPSVSRLYKWEEVFGRGTLERTISKHGEAIGAPSIKLSAACLARRIIGSVSRIQAWSINKEECAFSFNAEALMFRFVGFELESKLWLDSGSVLCLGQGYKSGSIETVRVDSEASLCGEAQTILARVIDNLAAVLSPVSRVSKQLLFAEAAVAWYAVIRFQGLPSDLAIQRFSEQWRHSTIDRFFHRYRLTNADGSLHPLLIRKTCCLEYKLVARDEPAYCTTCPLVPTEIVLSRRMKLLQGQPVTPGGFKVDDIRSAHSSRW